ncbi:MAG: type I DNA topoisomerase [Elusimicrobiota bacterium]|jgi:DNA topoisomerase-1
MPSKTTKKTKPVGKKQKEAPLSQLGSSGRSLVIVESPTKQKTIAKFLGDNFTIVATLGHIRDLPSRTLGVDEANNFEPQYVILPKAKKVLPSLREAIRKVERVYLATDFDREGEAIAWHVAEALKVPPERMARITFHEITPEAIKESLEHPRQIDLKLVHAQQARRILDRLVGYKLSPLLWAKVRKGLSAGRVQSVALRLLVEREIEIEAFRSQGYWTIMAELQKEGETPFEAALVEINGKKIEQTTVLKLFADDYHVTTTSLTEQPAVDGLLERLKKAQYHVSEVVRKETRRSPAPPFMTATLQQDASRRLGFSAVKTMVVAQQLYEGVDLGSSGMVGLITYMRTDSLNVAASAQEEARQFIQSRYGEGFLPEAPRVYKTKSKAAQEAHEAIRPTSVTRTPESLKEFLSPEQGRLYDLIWRRFMASQMEDAVFDTVGVDITARVAEETTSFLFHASGRTIKAPGYLKVYTEVEDKETAEKMEGQKLPLLAEKDLLQLVKIISEDHKTEPPPRFNEASLIKMLERHGIGRPSTYAPILQTIIGRGYAREENRRLYPADLGRYVTELLKAHFKEIVDLNFTARVEERLDEIAQGDVRWPEVIKDFYDPFMNDLQVAQTAITTKPYEPKESGELCEKCGAPMLIRESRFGRYMSCKTYPVCKNKISLDSQGKKIMPEVTDKKCEKCQKPLVKRFGRRGPFLACSGYPDCKTTYSIDKEGNIVIKPPPEMTDKKCEKCGKPMLRRIGKRGPFLTCSGFPRCRNLKKDA